MAHVITDSLLEDHLKCHPKSYLRLHGRSGQTRFLLCVRDWMLTTMQVHRNGWPLNRLQSASIISADRVFRS